MIALYVLLYFVCDIMIANSLYRTRKRGGLWVTRTIFVVYVIFGPITLAIRALYLLFAFLVYTPIAFAVAMIMSLGADIVSAWEGLVKIWKTFDRTTP